MNRSLLFLIISLFVFTAGKAQIITTLAGNGFSGHSGDGGPSTGAVLTTPFGVTVDSKGNIYVAEYSNYVRKIDHWGIITTIAGAGPVPLSGGPLGDGGPATAAFMDVIYDLAVDASDNLYIADHTFGRVRKVDASGTISTYAGGGSFLGNGAPASASNLIGMNGITIDGTGNMYVCMGPIIRKIDAATGTINTIAGTGTAGYSGDGGPATNALLNSAYDIAADKAGNLYFTDQNTNCVRKINTSGYISTVAGNGSTTGSFGGDGGPATAGLFNLPWGIAADAYDNMYVCDLWNNRLRKINTTTGIITSVVGSGIGGFGGDGGPAISAQYAPDNIAIDCSGNFFLTGSWDRLRKVTFVHTPYFTAASDSIVVCENAESVSIDTILAAGEIDKLDPLNWAIDVPPAHGTITGAIYTTLSTGDTVVPVGLYYVPGRGFTGTDSFVMKVYYCGQVADRRTIYVRMKALPVVASITGIDSVCVGSMISLSDVTPGGSWSMFHPGASITTTGFAAGVFAGSDSVIYAVTDLATGCTNNAWHALRVVDCPEGVKPISTKGGLRSYPNPVTDVLTIEGVQPGTSYRLLNIMGAVMQEGALGNGVNHLSTKELPKGVYMLEVADAATGERLTRRIVKE